MKLLLRLPWNWAKSPGGASKHLLILAGGAEWTPGAWPGEGEGQTCHSTFPQAPVFPLVEGLVEFGHTSSRFFGWLSATSLQYWWLSQAALRLESEIWTLMDPSEILCDVESNKKTMKCHGYMLKETQLDHAGSSAVTATKL